jgi:prepilin-type N-terminal cleavage/methylation domain-containing protein
MESKKGFTLIELLVVVLIVGIIAAIALPQYETAVLKSRLSSVMSNIKTIKNAEEVFYLINGRYTGNISELDINIPQCVYSKLGIMDCEGISYYDHDGAVAGNYGEKINGYLYNSGRTSWRIGYVAVFDNTIIDAGKVYCVVSNVSDKSAVRVCESLSKKKINNTKWEL